ncbi:MAG TPA: TQO small subunit DoxD [Thermoleophilaceae bacterium]
MALLPLRLFLGVTFIYAGVQKLSDPGFLHKGAPTYIGTQLHGFANGTPGGFLLRAFAIPHPGLAGVGVAITEIAVGILVTAGLLTRPAAAVGLALNLILFLTNSWHTYPYFLGSDIVFVFAWLPFVIAGAEGQPSLDAELARRSQVARPRPGRRGAAPAGSLVTRRVLLRQALLGAGAATLGIAGIAYAAKGSYRGAGSTTLGAARRPKRRQAGSSHTHHHASHASAGGGNVPQGAVRLGPSNAVPRGKAALYRDPSDGQPDVIIRDSSGQLTAMSAVCTHAGCQVSYQSGQLYCPCHGSVFNARTGAVERGPASQPLAIKHVTESGGEIYAVPS